MDRCGKLCYLFLMSEFVAGWGCLGLFSLQLYGFTLSLGYGNTEYEKTKLKRANLPWSFRNFAAMLGLTRGGVYDGANAAEIAIQVFSQEEVEEKAE